MSIIKCTCSYYKCIEYGLKPKDHNHECPAFLGYNNERIFNKELSPFKEEWKSKKDRDIYYKKYDKLLWRN